MSWLSVTLTADADSVEALSDALVAAGAVAVEVTDASAGTPREHAMFATPGESGAPGWTLSNISALFGDHHDITASVAAALRAAGLEPARSFAVERVADRDWVRATQSQDRKSTRLNSSHSRASRMPSSA